MKIDIAIVAASLKKYEIDPSTMRKIIEDLNFEAQPEPGEEKEPPVKKQYAFLLSDPEGDMPKKDFTGWVVQLPENESGATVPDRILRAIEEFNLSKKGMVNPLRTIGEAMESLPSRLLKDKDIWIKTKTPVWVLKTDNRVTSPLT